MARPSPDPLRLPAVAGSFYPADPAVLGAEVRALLGPEIGGGRPPQTAAGLAPVSCRAVIAPHAGYVYSGRVAGLTYARTRVPRRVVVVAVNHRGHGSPVATWERGAWLTPLGPVAVDIELVAAIARRAPLVHDQLAHAGEHSLEVQLPFLQECGPPDLKLAPILLATHHLGTLAEVGEAVAAAVEEAGEPVLVVASTDFTHYRPAAVARSEDAHALAAIAAVDGPGLLRVVRERAISMCGVAPTTAALIAARALGASEATLVRYATSGDVTGDDDSVVGYAGLLVP